MTERIIPSQAFGSKLATLLPSVAGSGERSHERVQAHPLSLYVPDAHDWKNYSHVLGNVFDLPRASRIDITGLHHPDLREIELGDYVSRVAVPNNLGAGDFPFLVPVGVDMLRQGKSVSGHRFHNNRFMPDESTQIDVFARTIEEIPQKAQDTLHGLYHARKTVIEASEDLVVGMAGQDLAAAESNILLGNFFGKKDGLGRVGDMSYRFGTFDRRLVTPRLAELNPGRLSFNRLQELYPKRIEALREGYVTFDQFRLNQVEESLVTTPDVIVPGIQAYRGHVIIPSLHSLYLAYSLDQAGFDIQLAEAEVPPGYPDTDRVASTAFALMVKPREAAKS